MDVMEPGAAISRELAGGAGEGADAQIDAFISRRHEQRVKSEGERPAEEAFMVSERAYFARLDEERRLARLTYHQGQVSRLSNTLSDLVAYHQGEAEKLMKDHERKAS